MGGARVDAYGCGKGQEQLFLSFYYIVLPLTSRSCSATTPLATTCVDTTSREKLPKTTTVAALQQQNPHPISNRALFVYIWWKDES